MRNRMIAGNWKMNKTYTEGVALMQDLASELKDGTGDVDVVVCPPTVDLKGVSAVIDQESAPVALGAQNVYWEESGAFTGETAPDMLTNIGATYCIIGHSERRGYFGETDEDINKKAKALPAELVEALPEVPAGVEVLVCPPTIDLCCVAHKLEGSAIALGAQNCYWEASGAYTGETSVPMLKSAGCTYCIIGHSERRDYFHESDEDQNKKAKALVAGGIVPVFCCGEPLEVREAGTYVEHVVAQVKAGLEGLELASADQLVVAYEPIWAIGTGMTATADDAQEVCHAVREALVELFGAEMADGIRVLYGGSAKPGNIAELVAKPDVDGALVGGASLKAADFSEMVVKAAE